MLGDSLRRWLVAALPRLRVGALLWASLFLACTSDNQVNPDRDGGSDSAADIAAPQDSDAGPFHGVILGRLSNNLCLPFALPTNVAGDKASCRIVLEGESSGCGHPGLQPAAAGDLAAIDAYRKAHGQVALPGATCEVAQLPASTNCTDQTSPGWCYVNSACAADAGVSCKDDICSSVGLIAQNISYGVVWLVCD
jgi:hypothetical protein